MYINVIVILFACLNLSRLARAWHSNQLNPTKLANRTELN